MTASSHPTAAVARRRRRIALSILACIAVIAAGLLTYTGALRDDVVLAGIVSSSGDLGFVPMNEGRTMATRLGAREPKQDVADASKPAGAARATQGSGGSGGTEAIDGGPDGGFTGTGIEQGDAGGDSTPGSSDGTATGAGVGASVGTKVTLDGFRFDASGNMQPGDTSTGSATLRNTGDTDGNVRLELVGTDPYDCFRYSATQFAQQPDGTFERQGVIGTDLSPASGGSLDLGTWKAGGVYRTDVSLTMRTSCTVGSGRSSNGSTALADRNPEHASARLDFRYVTGGAVG